MTSMALTDILWARSATEMVSGTCTSRTIGSVGRRKPSFPDDDRCRDRRCGHRRASRRHRRWCRRGLDAATTLGVGGDFLADDLLDVLADALVFGLGGLVSVPDFGAASPSIFAFSAAATRLFVFGALQHGGAGTGSRSCFSFRSAA
jgi:hypothetical protein